MPKKLAPMALAWDYLWLKKWLRLRVEQSFLRPKKAKEALLALVSLKAKLEILPTGEVTIFNFAIFKKMPKIYDLENRTRQFAVDVIKFCKTLRQNSISRPLISQLVRSGSSIGANYCEANGASSKKDFRNKIYICKKEAQESRYWLKLLKETFPDKDTDIDELLKEVEELIKILQTIAKNTSIEN